MLSFLVVGRQATAVSSVIARAALCGRTISTTGLQRAEALHELEELGDEEPEPQHRAEEQDPARVGSGALATQSEAFRTKWAAHNVRFHDTGAKRFHHPVVGDLTLSYETMQLSADAGLTIAAYTAEPGSKSEEMLNLLASWAATLDQAEPAHATGGA